MKTKKIVFCKSCVVSNLRPRIYIDKNEGISVEDCEMVSKHVSKVLDTVNGFSENYILEVSSPGLDRKFFYNDQYEDYINQPLKVTFLDSQNKKTIQGRLQGVDKTSIRLEIKEGPMQIAFSSIIRANLII